MKIEIREAPGKGRGVFAKSRIKAREVIEVCPAIPLTEKEHNRWICKTVLESYVFSFPVKGQRTLDVNRWKGSCVVLGWGSIYNHSFNPNSEWVADAKTQTFTFTALKPIKPGEEITHNYYWPDEMYKKVGIPLP